MRQLVSYSTLVALVITSLLMPPAASAQSGSDSAVPGGWFYTQATVRSGFGYTVVDDAAAPFWTEYRRLGGPASLGHPVSRRYLGSDGYLYQAFERFILQWRPDQQRAVIANVFEQFSEAGLDDWLVAHGIPKPEPPGSGTFADDARRRMAWLTESRFLGFYLLNPLTQKPWEYYEQAWDRYGLPQTGPQRLSLSVGSPLLWPFIVQRFQKAAFQLWLEPGPGIPPGTVSIVTAGTLARLGGLIPISAIVPEPPPSSAPWIVGQPALAGTSLQSLEQPLRHFAIGGAGFGAGESVTVSLVQDGDESTPPVTLTLTGTAKPDGSFIVEGETVAGTYSVTARGHRSGTMAADTLILR